MQRTVSFDIRTLVRLMCAYTGGIIPADAEVRIAGPHKYLNGWFGMVINSRQWAAGSRMEEPIVFRYEGKKNMILVGRGKEWQITERQG